jgi:glycosyltransferase involved in cell wall biosynthesis
MNLPPVSVIIPTYNRIGDLLAQAIDSVLKQSHKDFELLVVDDGSTDDTTAWLKRNYGQKIRVLVTENRGPAAARNHGLENSRHDLIAFLDSDDWWHKDKLQVQAKVMFNEEQYLISHTDEIWYRRGKYLNQKKKHQRPHGIIFTSCLPLCCVGMSTVMMRREFFKRVGLFDAALPCCEDYDLWLRASPLVEFYKIDQPLTTKQGGRDDQVSVQYQVGMDQFRITSLEKCLHLNSFSKEQKKMLALELVKKSTIYGNGCIKHGRHELGKQYLQLANRWQSF